jgi:hypothetical protein
MIDPLDIQLARYLDEIDALDAKNEWVDRRAAELLQDEYSPKRRDSLIEAIGNTTPSNQELITMLVNTNDGSLASLIEDISYMYWCEQAERRAELEWQRR